MNETFIKEIASYIPAFCLAMFKDNLKNMPYESTAILTIFLVLIFCFVSYLHGRSLENKRAWKIDD